MDEVANLQHLSLVSKICIELENHYELGDKDLGKVYFYNSFITRRNCSMLYVMYFFRYLYYEIKCMKLDTKIVNVKCLCLISAEFIIHLAEENDTFDKFKNVLIDNGAEFEVSSNVFFDNY